jgi:hypothetical protein
MKTPREILLARHRAAAPQLDAIRHAVVNDLSRPTPGGAWLANLVAACLRLLTAPWRELVLPARRTWTALAAVWVLLLVINLSQRDPVSSVTGRLARPQPVMMSWQAQQRWLNELLTDRAAPADTDRPRNTAPRPRTENGETALV